MRILVLGASGFLGRHLIAGLANSGWAKPIAGVHRPAALATGGEIVTLDATDPSAISEAIRNAQAEAIVNCVVGSEDTIRRNADALLTAATAANIPVVYLSSMAVYGKATGLLDEDAELREDAGKYGAAKVYAERALAKATIPLTILRPGCIYGSDSPQWTERIERLLREGRIGDLGPEGCGPSNLVHFQDVVAAILLALRGTTRNVRAYNLAAPDSPDWNGYFRAVAQSIALSRVKPIPAWRLQLETHVLFPFLHIGSKLSAAVPPAIVPSLARLWKLDLCLDSRRATQELGVSWTSLSSGLSEATAGRNVRAASTRTSL